MCVCVCVGGGSQNPFTCNKQLWSTCPHTNLRIEACTSTSVCPADEPPDSTPDKCTVRECTQHKLWYSRTHRHQSRLCKTLALQRGLVCTAGCTHHPNFTMHAKIEKTSLTSLPLLSSATPHIAFSDGWSGHRFRAYLYTMKPLKPGVCQTFSTVYRPAKCHWQRMNKIQRKASEARAAIVKLSYNKPGLLLTLGYNEQILMH